MDIYHYLLEFYEYLSEKLISSCKSIFYIKDAKRNGAFPKKASFFYILIKSLSL